MIIYMRGNLLESKAQALVNAVNTAGKGIAAQFKERFPENFKAYAIACKAGNVQIGRMHVTSPRRGADGEEICRPRWIINFPTKRHWRNPSRLSWINDGLVDLRRFIEINNVESMAIPALGVGNGGLSRPIVRRDIEKSWAA